MNTRLRQLDGLRGFLAIAVVVFHLERSLTVSPVVLAYVNLGWAAVPGFFALSGYLIARQLDGDMPTAEFWRRRFRRILPLYLLVMAFCAVVFGLGDVPAWGLPFLPVWSANGIRCTGEMEPLWSITNEAAFYLAAPFLLRRESWAPVWLWPLLWTGVKVALTSESMWWGYYCGQWDGFAWGVLAYRLSQELDTDGAFWRLALWGGALVCLAPWAGIALGESGNFLFASTGAGIATAGCVVLAARGRLFDFEPFEVTGRWSYGLYVWHQPVLLSVLA